MYGYTEQQVKQAKQVIITHPYFGTLCMEVKKVTSGNVEGLVWNETGYYQYNMPDDYHGEDEYMNFPISCVKSIL